MYGGEDARYGERTSIRGIVVFQIGCVEHEGYVPHRPVSSPSLVVLKDILIITVILKGNYTILTTCSEQLTATQHTT